MRGPPAGTRAAVPMSDRGISAPRNQGSSQARQLDAGLREQRLVKVGVFWAGVIVAILHLVMNFTTLFSTQWQATTHFVGLGLMALLLYPARRSERFAGSRSES